MMLRQEIAALKPGDEVAWSRGDKWTITTVDRLGPTSFTTRDGQRWTYKHGKLFGSESGRTHLEIVTQAIRDAIVKQDLVVRLGKIEWSTHSLATLQQIITLVETAP